MLNEASNSNDAMCVANNVRLITMGAKQFSVAAMYNWDELERAPL